MKITAVWLIIATFAVTAVLAAALDRRRVQVLSPTEGPYQTGCEAVDETTVEGFVKNPGTGIIRIDGLVRFTFTVANSMSRAAVQVQGAAIVPPGRTVSVARARLVWSLLPGEVCQLDVSGAVR